jgi:hypothetical protein
VNIAGSFNAKVWYGPDPRNVTKEYFDATVENCRKVIDEVGPRRTAFSIEMSPWNLPDGPDEYVRLIRAVDRSAFAGIWTSATSLTVLASYTGMQR